MDGRILHKQLTDKIIGVFYDVYNELGSGFLESVYEEAMMISLDSDGFLAERQVGIPVWFRGRILGNFAADIVVERKVIIEIKPVSQLADAHAAQLMHYLRATEIEVGLLMNFGHCPEFKRRVFENSRKGHAGSQSSINENLFS